MKASNENVRVNDLLIDVVEYAFLEWLIRRGILTAFKKNYECEYAPRRSFRDRLRSHIRHSLYCSRLGPSHLISSAFLFWSTSEGVDFWRKESAAWERFCAELQVKL